MAAKALKARNNATLWTIIAVDALVIFVVTSWASLGQVFDWTTVTALRGVLASCVPVVVLLLNSLLPAKVKAILVFWRFTDVLPGHRAFSKHALRDPRIDIERLRKHIGGFPADPQEQNAVWYRLFKKGETETTIEHVHQQFLLLRDLASLSVLLLMAAALGWLSGVLTTSQVLSTVGVFGIQYVLASLGASAQGKGLVTSVLALHSVKRRV